MIGPERRRQDDAAADPRRRAAAERRARSSLERGTVGWVPQQPALYSKLSVAENLRLFARLEKRRRRATPTVARMLEQTGAARPRRRRGRQALGRQPPAGQHRDRPARATRRCCCSTSRPSSLDPRQRERLWDVRRPGSPRPAPSVVYPPTTSARPSATPTACSCSPTASCCSPARPRELEADRAATPRARLRGRVRRASSTSRATEPCAGCCSRTCRSCAARRCWSRCSSIYPIVIARAVRRSRCPAARTSRRSRSPTSCRTATAEFRARRPHARRRRTTRTSCSTSIDPIRVDSARGGDREGPVRRGAGGARDPGGRDRSGCRATLGLGGGEPPDGRGLLQRRGPGEAPLRRGRRSRRALAEANAALSDAVLQRVGAATST